MKIILIFPDYAQKKTATKVKLLSGCQSTPEKNVDAHLCYKWNKHDKNNML